MKVTSIKGPSRSYSEAYQRNKLINHCTFPHRSHLNRSLGVYSMSHKSLDSYISSDNEKQSLIDDAIAWCSQHGLVYGAGLKDHPEALVHAPFSLLPVAYPQQTFLLAKQAATAFNTMIDAVSQDDEYLCRVLIPAAKNDEFTAKLLQVHQSTADARASRKGRDLSLAINRSDYMLHSPTDSLLQVELNTIASSFGCLSTLVGRLHRYVIGRMMSTPADIQSILPENNAMECIADALGAAVNAHGAPNGVVIMVVQPGERNAYDQQWLQLTLWERHGIRTLRRTLHDISTRGAIHEITGHLSIDNHIASVVYYRAGYTPDDYPSEIEWNGRILVEKSDAAVCPSVALQLAGSKKVQQDLANPGVVEKYAANEGDAKLIRMFFAGLWGLDDLSHDKEAATAVADALKNPDNYVLKPQREGGGNNLYGEALKTKLEQGAGHLDDLILMQRIRPPVNISTMVRFGKAAQVETLSELGIYATFLRRGRDILVNKEAGHLVRTKAATSDEGGVAAGFAVLDSPWFHCE